MGRKKKAAALQYSKGDLDIPRITALGTGEIADKIIKKAVQNGVEILKNDAFFEHEKLFKLAGEIPPDVYEIVVEILTYILKTNNEVKDAK